MAHLATGTKNLLTYLLTVLPWVCRLPCSLFVLGVFFQPLRSFSLSLTGGGCGLGFGLGSLLSPSLLAPAFSLHRRSLTSLSLSPPLISWLSIFPMKISILMHPFHQHQSQSKQFLLAPISVRVSTGSLTGSYTGGDAG